MLTTILFHILFQVFLPLVIVLSPVNLIMYEDGSYVYKGEVGCVPQTHCDNSEPDPAMINWFSDGSYLLIHPDGSVTSGTIFDDNLGR